MDEPAGGVASEPPVAEIVRVIPRESPGVGGDVWAREVPPAALAPRLQDVHDAIISDGAAETHRAVRSDWGKFERWCTRQGVASLQAHPLTVCVYLQEHSKLVTPDGRPSYAVATLRRWVSSINREHRTAAAERRHRGENDADLQAPGEDDRVRKMLRRIARDRAEAGQGGQRQAEPLRAAHLRTILEGMKPRSILAGAWDLRDAALLGLGWRCALRRSELTAIRYADVRPSPDGRWRVCVASSKTDQQGQGAVLALSVTRAPLTCVPCALVRWSGLLRAVKHPHRHEDTCEEFTPQEMVVDYLSNHPAWAGQHVCGTGLPDGLDEQMPLLRPLAPDGVPRDRRLSGAAVNNVVRHRAASIGLKAAEFSGHSLRAGFVTEASVLGVPGDQIAAQTRHGSLDMVARYRRLHDPHTGNAEGLLPG